MTTPYLSLFLRGLEDIIPDEIENILKTTTKQLTVKWGADPSAPDLHLGHMVVLKKLSLLQKMGHKVLFVIGDFTARIGDPTGRSETRKPLTLEDVKQNAGTYQTQVFKLLDQSKTDVVFNSSWLNKLTPQDIIALTSRYTVARMLERDDFSKRYKSEKPIGIHEFLYPLLQGYDSVELENDIEMGGTDQKFNLLVGRQLQKDYGKKQQAIITTPILEGLDGVQKMSKSLNNHIGILEPASEIFGKIMSIPDPLITRYFMLLTEKDPEYLKEIESKMASGELNPRYVKEDLAIEIVTGLKSAEEAQKAKEQFAQVFAKKEVPDDMPEIRLPNEAMLLRDFIFSENLVASKKEIGRLIDQGAIKLDGKKAETINDTLSLGSEQILKIGKRKFYKLVK